MSTLGHQSITGTVTNSAGTDLANICVQADTVAGGYGGFGETASNGTYTVTGLTAGSFTVEFYNCGDGNYAPQYYNDTAAGTPLLSGATAVAVPAGSSTTGVSAVMALGTTISGTVTNSSGTKLSDICVFADIGDGSGGSATTASDGTYAMTNLAPGSYTVEFYSDCGGGNYLPQYYNGTTAGTSSSTSATSIAVTVASPKTGINAVMTTGATISGIVTDSSGAGISGVCVYAIPVGNGTGASATTASNGTYTVAGLVPGSYTVEFYSGCGSSNYLTQYYNGTTAGTSSSTSATSIAVTVASPKTGINAVMTTGATISGTVTNSSGAGLSGVCVYAIPVGNGTGASAATASNGSYTVTGLAPGSYTLEFYSGCGTSSISYVSQYYNGTSVGTSSYAGATSVAVTVASPKTGINVEMTAGAVISGIVTNSSGAGLSGVCVDANPVGGGSALAISTGLDGAYSLIVAPGNYTVDFYSECGAGNYASQYYNGTSVGTSSYAGATSIAATVASPKTGIDAVMTVGATISGNVTAAVGGTPLSSVCVEAISTDGGFGTATTASNGSYTVTGLAPGSYTVEFYIGCGSGNYATQYYNGTTAGTPSSTNATSIAVTVASPKTGINAAMTLGTSITGKVTAAVGGAPLSGVCVYASASDGAFGVVTTAADGTYTITGLLPDSYTVEFFTTQCTGAPNYATQYYNGTTAGTSSSSNATLIAVTVASPKTGINAVMTTGATISGTVTNASGTAVVNACVIVSLSGSNYGYSASTAGNGTYTISGLAAGSYSITVDPTCFGSVTSTYAQQFINSVGVTAGATTTENVVLALGGTISGKVTNASGTGVANVCINVNSSDGGNGYGSATTASSGTYTISGLAADSYSLSVDPTCGGSVNSTYAQQFINSVGVTAGVTTTKSVVLALGGTISGKVTNASGTGVANVCINVNSSNGGNGFGSATTASNGTYTISGVATGSYRVDVDPTCGDSATSTYAQQFINSLGVTAGVTTTENVVLGLGGTISGTVTGTSGASVANVCINVNSSDGGNGYGFATTASNGTYTISGLAADSYSLSVDPTCGGSVNSTYAQQFISSVGVTAGVTTTKSVVLVKGGIVSGAVTFSGTGVGGVCVNFYQGNVGDGGTNTASNGTYTINLAPGTYSINVDPTCGGSTTSPYAPQTLNNAVTVTVGVTTTKNIALSNGGTVSGTVTYNSVGVGGVCVNFNQGNVGDGGTTTASNGTYSMNLAPGTYNVNVDPTCGGSTTSPYVSQFSNSVTVVASTTTTKSFALTKGGTVSGSVTYNSVGVGGVCVNFNQGNVNDGGTNTASNGTYSMNLAPGTYNVNIDPTCGGSTTSPYVPQFSNTVTVVASTTTTKSFALTKGGTVSGSVTYNSVGVGGVCVGFTQSSVYDGGMTTASNGTYSVVLAPGTYNVNIDPTCGGSTTSPYVPQSLNNAVTIVVSTTTTKSFALIKGGTVSGSVTFSGAGVGGVCVNFNQGNVGDGGTTTASNGTYSMNLAPGTYNISVDPTCGGSTASPYAPQNLINAVTVVVSTTTTKNVALSDGGTVSGTVTYNSVGVGGVCVSFNQNNVYEGGSTTASNGTYSVALAPGVYSVNIDPTCGGSTASPYVPQFLNNAVTIVASTTTTKNVALIEGGTVSGTVTYNSVGVGGVCVNFSQGNVGDGGTTTASNGTYSISLAPGVYSVNIDPTCGGSTTSPYVPQSLNNAVTVVVSTTTTKSVVLSLGGTVAGTVTYNNVGVGGVCVNFSQGNIGDGGTTTASNGTYSMKLAAGTYSVYIDPTCGGSTTSPYTPQSLNNAVTIVASTTTTKNVVLSLGGTVSGTISFNGAGVGGVCVDFINGSVGAGGTITASNGTYSMILVPGTYSVYVDPTCSGSTTSLYVPQSLSNAVVVVASTTTTKSVALSEGGTVSGTVTFNGAGVGGVCVTFNQTNSDGGSTSASNGSYSMNLAPGTYDVNVDPTCGGTKTSTYATQFLNTVTVTTGATITKNVVLGLGSIVSGTVSFDGVGVQGVCVNFNNGSGGDGNEATANNGTYSMNLPPGTYNVIIDPTCSGSTISPYASQTLHSAFTLTAGANPVENFSLVTAQTPLSVANTTLTGTAGTALTLTSAGGAGPGLVSYSVTSTGTGNVCAIT
ncbi:MAG TPA: carboxypeptidase-like regulatory domain-containing protein, partial [Acidimicrobiales bacterium]